MTILTKLRLKVKYSTNICKLSVHYIDLKYHKCDDVPMIKNRIGQQNSENITPT